MLMTNMKEIKKMNDKDLASFIEEKRESIRNFRFNAAARDVRAVRTAKKEIARGLTELTTRLPERDHSQSGNKASKEASTK